MSKEKGHISVETSNIFPIIKKFLYSDQEIFLRELVSNAIDATSKIKTLASRGEFKGEVGDDTIRITLDKEAKTITISDRGIGMTSEEVKKYLNQVAFSSAEAFLKKYQDDAKIIGHFGLGFYSAFMVAEKVEVITKSYKRSKAVRWICKGEPSYVMEQHDKKERGTDIILHISDEGKDYLEDGEIQKLLDKYAKFLPIPIQFGTKTEHYEEGEGEDAESKTREVPNIVNNTKPAWVKTPRSLKEEDYISFYKELNPFSADPLFWIHLNMDFPFNLTGILYFPKVQNMMDLQKNKIKLYSNQVYVTDEVKDIVPEFLTLLHGVIDSPDIPLNVSRSALQSDSNVKKITAYITKKVGEKLNSLFKKNREAYQSKWDSIGVFVKYGMITEDKFYDKAMKFVLLKNTDDEFYTIEEYRSKIEANQKDKHDKLVVLYSPTPAEHNSYIQSAKNKGYDVIVTDPSIDGHFIQRLEQKLGDILFVRVDSDVVDNLIQKDENAESVLTEKEEEKVSGIFKSMLGEGVSNVDLKALSPEDHPVIITKPEFMRRMREMQSFQGMEGLPDSFTVVVNTNHPLIAQRLLRAKGEERRNDLAKHLYQLALLNQGMLKGEEMSAFVSKSLDFLN